MAGPRLPPLTKLKPPPAAHKFPPALALVRGQGRGAAAAGDGAASRTPLAAHRGRNGRAGGGSSAAKKAKTTSSALKRREKKRAAAAAEAAAHAADGGGDAPPSAAALAGARRGASIFGDGFLSEDHEQSASQMPTPRG